jgi:D-alanine-D-alanine ligase
MNIAVIYSNPSKRILKTEYGVADEDSSTIARMVARGLEARGFVVNLYSIYEDTIEDISKIKADCIFNLIEWCGQDISLSQKAFHYLRKLNVPITGASEYMFVLSGDKIRAKKEFNKIGMPTPTSVELATGNEKIPLTLPYPVIVKPSLEHCSMGLSYDAIAYDESELRTIAKRQIKSFSQPVLAEEFIKGRELLVYLLEVGKNLIILPIEEMIFSLKRDINFQTFKTKWDPSSEEYNSTDVVIAKLSTREKIIVEKVCKTTFKKMGFTGYARFDLRLRDGIPYILETNANPSVYDNEDELKDIETEVIWGIKFPDYLLAIVNSALYHYKKMS